MHSIDNFYKLRCAALQEQKEKLLKKIKLLDEEIAGSAGMAASDGNYDIGQEPVIGMGRFSKSQKPRRGKKGSVKQEIPQEEQGMQPQQDPYEVTGQHGFVTYGIGREGLRDVLQRYYDEPQTPEVEVPEKPDWQSSNAAISNYMDVKLQQLKRQQGMI